MSLKNIANFPVGTGPTCRGKETKIKHVRK